MIKICIITCYNQPDYIRAKTLRVAASLLNDANVFIIKNNNLGILRYIETLSKLIKIRFGENPDIYILTFRGYEMLLPVRLITLGKQLIYDEFINPIEWVVHERRQVEAGRKSSAAYGKLVAFISRLIVFTVSSKLFKQFYNVLVRSTDLVITDTKSHADISSELTGLNREKIMDIPVGTDELTFNGMPKGVVKNDGYTVLYYGNMLPLHGLKYVIEAAEKLASKPIRFVIIGGSKKTTQDVERAIDNGANIDYKPWVEYEQLPEIMQKSDLCVAGPFGGTFQARFVITGKAFQYMAMAKPMLIGENEESGIFTDKKNALIVPQANVDEIVDAIVWASEHPEKLLKIAKSGRQLYDKEFSMDRISERLSAAIERAIS